MQKQQPTNKQTKAPKPYGDSSAIQCSCTKDKSFRIYGSTMKKAATARAIWKNPRQETGQVVVVLLIR